MFREERGLGRGKSKFKAWSWVRFPRGGLETGARASREDLDKHVGGEQTGRGRWLGVPGKLTPSSGGSGANTAPKSCLSLRHITGAQKKAAVSHQSTRPRRETLSPAHMS